MVLNDNQLLGFVSMDDIMDALLAGID
ncbi:hypothetical protein ACT691_18440 [Vibrio metschnikovii]